MKIGIMQPYFMPYIGYFQLMNLVDEFVIYDNIEYTKKGWINRNRILVDGKESYISLPLKKDSDFLTIKNRFLVEDIITEKKRIIRRIINSYRKAPCFDKIYPKIEKIILYNDNNLFNYVFHSIISLNEILEIKTQLIISSQLSINHGLRAEKKVIEIAKHRGASSYINPIGGVNLYNKDSFNKHQLVLSFLKTNDIKYKQYENEFIPNLSILDVLMFNSTDNIKKILSEYVLI